VGSEVDVQLGGGIRDLDTIERYLDAGLRYVIIGTAAVKNPGFLQDACTAFGGHIIVGPGCQATARSPPTAGAS
jgi:phosphoribosylformimino-5-aminoimidazole carboxamide ribotide isomerase